MPDRPPSNLPTWIAVIATVLSMLVIFGMFDSPENPPKSPMACFMHGGAICKPAH
jgi:hypothetical protein